MVEIYEHSSYTEPVDMIKVGYLKVPSYTGDKNSGPQFVKAFRIIDNIWLVPRRYMYGKNPQSIKRPTETTSNLYHYDESYLSSESHRTIWLQQMTKIFKRLNSVATGAKLLEAINNSTPLSRSSSNRYVTSNSVTIYSNSTGTGDSRSYAASTVIYGPDIKVNVHKTQACGKLARTDKVRDFCGYQAELLFAPDVLETFSKTESLSHAEISYALDPAVTLAHELTHCLRLCYGVQQIIPSTRAQDDLTIEEQIAVNIKSLSTDDRNIFDKKRNMYYRVYVNDIKRRLTELSTDPPVFKRYLNKYFAKYINNQVIVDSIKFRDLYSMLTEINEYTINMEFQQTNKNIELRDKYGKAAQICLKANLLDNHLYRIDTGLIKYTVHRHKTLLADEYELLSLGSGTVQACASGGTRFANAVCVPIEEDLYTPVNAERYKDNEYTFSFSSSYKDENIPFDKVNVLSIDIPTNDNSAINAYETPIDELAPQNAPTAVPNIDTDGYNAYHIITANDIDGVSETESLEFMDLNNDNIPSALSNRNNVLNAFPDVKTKLDTFSQAGNYLGAALYAKSVSEAFQEGSTEKIVEAGVSIVPYAGPLINFAKGNFVEAMKDAALQTLFLAVPELYLPYLSVSFLFGVENRESQKDKYTNILDNVLDSSDYVISSICLFYLRQWTSVNVKHGKNIKAALEDSLYKQSKIVAHQLNINLGTLVSDSIISVEQKMEILNQAKSNLYIAARAGVGNLSEMVDDAVINNFLDDSNVTPYLKSINNSIDQLTNTIREDFAKLVNNDPDLTVSQKEMLRKQINHVLDEYYGPVSFSKEELKRHILGETSVIDSIALDVGPYNSRYPNVTDLDSLYYDKINNDTFIDFENGTESDISLAKGRDRYCLQMKNGFVSIRNEVLTALTVEADFCLSIWLRVPLLDKLSAENFKMHTPIFRLNINKPHANIHDTGLGINIESGLLEVQWLQDDHNDNLAFRFYLTSSEIIADNCWHLIQISLSKKRFTLIIDGKEDSVTQISPVALGDYPMNNYMNLGLLHNTFSTRLQVGSIKLFINSDITDKSDTLYNYELNNDYLYDYWGNRIFTGQNYHLVPKSKLGLESWLHPLDVDTYYLESGAVKAFHINNYFTQYDCYTGTELCVTDTGDNPYPPGSYVNNNQLVNMYFPYNDRNIANSKYYLYGNSNNEELFYQQKKVAGTEIILQKTIDSDTTQRSNYSLALFTSRRGAAELSKLRYIYGAMKVNENNQILQGEDGSGYIGMFDNPDISNVSDKEAISFYLIPEDDGWKPDNAKEKFVRDTNGVEVCTGFGYKMAMYRPNYRDIHYIIANDANTWLYGTPSIEHAERQFIGPIKTNQKERIIEGQAYYMNTGIAYWRAQEVSTWYPNGGVYLSSDYEPFYYSAGKHGYTTTDHFYYSISQGIVKKENEGGEIEFRFITNN